ncbi:MAG: helix-turn-helix domain-containing protein [Bacteroidota bacterium]|nr:helix-turn-helix domain-containing protein [Bacteroidota bacterium]
MDQEEILRQKAIQLHFQGFTATEIAEQLQKTRQWVYKWLKRYAQTDNKNWFVNESFVPKTINSKIDEGLQNLIIEIRNRLSGLPYAQKGAISILYELERLGVRPPSLATINRILSRNNLIRKSKVERKKQTEYPDHFFNVQQMDLIGPKYLKGGFRFYFFNIIDTANHNAGVYPILNKSAESIAPCLIDFWRNYQMPDFLQMDNELSFRGSNRYPRGLGLLMRVALSNGVSPVFIPPAEPWRNGIIEKFNNNVLKYFYDTQTFKSIDELNQRSKEFSVFHNENHRYSSQGNRTPNQLVRLMADKNTLDKDIDLSNKIFIESGRIFFIRFIRSDLKLRILDGIFDMNPALKYSYVIAEIILDKYLLAVTQNNFTYQVYPFPMSLP